MSIYVTGDIHGALSVKRLGTKGVLPKGLAKDDYAIICGDFGLVWFPEGDKRRKEDEWWLDWLEGKPFTTLFVDGNHENHDLLAALPVEMWHGGKVHKIREGVCHLMRGQVYDIDGKAFFTMGGAYSHDIEYRIEGESWWEDEVPGKTEREEALANLEACGWRVDYVLTHCAPSGVMHLARKHAEHAKVDEYTDWLEREVNAKLDYKRWFFGHYHKTAALPPKHFLLYGNIYDLDNGMLL